MRSNIALYIIVLTIKILLVFWQPVKVEKFKWESLKTHLLENGYDILLKG